MKRILVKESYLFLIFLYINVLCKGIGLGNDSKVYLVLIVFGFIFLFLKILNEKYNKKELCVSLLFIVIGLLCYVFTRKITLLLTCVCIAGMKNIDLDKTFKEMLYLRSGSFICVIILAMIGIIENSSVSMWRNGHMDIRYTLGFSHPNSLHLALFIIVSLFIYNNYEKMNFFKYFFVLVVNVFIYTYSGSRTGFFMINMLIIICCFSKNKNFKKLLLRMPKYIFIFVVFFSFVTAFLYGKYDVLNKLNIIFNGRIAYSNYYLTNYKLSLFGRNIINDRNALFDNGYIYCYVQYGVIGSILLSYVLLKICKSIEKEQSSKRAIIVIAFLIYCFTESIMPNVFMNIILLFFAPILFEKRGCAEDYEE